MAPRLVRRPSLWQRAQSLPSDAFYAVVERWAAVDWEEVDGQVTIPGGVVANVVLHLAAAAAGSRESHDVLITPRRSEGAGLGVAGWGRGLVVVLVALSLVNGYRCFFTRRAYRLFETSLQDAPRTPSAKIVRVQPQRPSSHSPLFVRLFGQDQDADGTGREVWEVGIWQPPPLTLSFFCYFSPLHAFLGCVYASLRTLLLLLLLSGQLKLLSHRFQLQQHDRRIIYGQVMQEYDSKFVRPRTSVRTRDVSIGVDGQVRVSTPIPPRPPAPSKQPPPPLYAMPKSNTISSGMDTMRWRMDPAGSSSRDYIPSPLSKRRKYDA